MSIEISIALLAFSGPVTAAVIKFLPGRNSKALEKNGKYVTIREYDLHKVDLMFRLKGIDGEIQATNSSIQDLTIAVNLRL